MVHTVVLENIRSVRSSVLGGVAINNDIVFWYCQNSGLGRRTVLEMPPYPTVRMRSVKWAVVI